MPMLNGRYGPYQPKTPAERAKARKQEAARKQAQLARQAWLEKHQTCANGCGKPVAFWDGKYLSLRYSGCCSAECEEANKLKKGRHHEPT